LAKHQAKEPVEYPTDLDNLMDLLGSYGSSDESEASGDEMKAVAADVPKAKPKPKKKVASMLPSAADAFSAVGAATFLTTKVAPEPEMQPMVKKHKPEEGNAGGESSVGSTYSRISGAKKPAVFLPPQIGRRGANVATEDVGKWNLAKTGGKGGKGGNGGGKDSFNAKEKRKRAEGKVAREGSFVEEEKRLLRQAGAD